MQNRRRDEIKEKGNVFPMSAMKVCRRSRGTTPLIFNLGIRWRSVDNFLPRLLYPREKSPVGIE
jgi:hypothetical protein